MTCPFLEEILMAYCRAYPIRKPVPKHQITTASPCMGEGYAQCPIFRELLVKFQAVASQDPRKICPKEVT